MGECPRTLAWTGLLVMAALLAEPAAAQDQPNVSLTVRGVAGVTLRAKRRHFIAVNVVLDNPSSQDTAGTLRVYRVKAPNSETPEQSLYYERQVEIPRSGRRVETIYYYVQENEPNRQLCVSFEPEEGTAPSPSYPRLEVVDNQRLILVISSRPHAVDSYARPLRAAVVPGVHRNYKTIIQRCELSALPDHMAGFDSFDTILVADLDPTDLSVERAAPLLDWVSAGGDLIVSFSGGRSELPPSITSVLPVAPTTRGAAVRQRDLKALRSMAPHKPLPRSLPVLVHQVDPLPGADVLAGDSAGPLVIRGRHGAGTITYTTFPLDAAPLRSWSGARGGIAEFGRNLLRAGRQDLEPLDEIPSQPPLEEILLNLSEALETLEPPSALIVAPLLLLYVALVSPLNFLILSRVKRLGMAQLSAGAVALFFGVLFFTIGFLYKGSDALVTQVSILEIPTSPGKSRVEVMSGYFATDRGLLDAEIPRGAAVGPIATKNASREARVVQSPDGTSLAAVTLDTWALRRFRTLRVEDIGHLAVDLKTSGRSSKITGTITNNTQLHLETAVLLFDNAFLALGAIEPGRTLSLSNSARNLDTNDPDIPLVAALHEDASFRHKNRYGKGIITGNDPYRGSKTGRILDSWRGRLARVPYAPGKRPALLLARVNHDAGGVVLEGGPQPTLARSIVVTEVQVATTPGMHTLRGLHPRIGDAKHWLSTGGQTGSKPMLKGADDIMSSPEKPPYVEFIWRLPASRTAPIVVDSLTFRWRLTPEPEPKKQRLQGYSFRTQTWLPIQDLGLVKLDRNGFGRFPEQAVNPLVNDLVDPNTGTILLRLFNLGRNATIDEMTLDVSFKQ